MNSYCNYLQEDLSSHRYNCKFALHRDTIYIIQTAPLLANEELSIQFSHDGSYWKDRIGYSPEVLALAYAKYFPHLPPPVPTERRQPTVPIPLPPLVNHQLLQTSHEFPLLHHDYLYQWQHDQLSNNMAIATLNLRGSPYSLRNEEPQFLRTMMIQLGLNILGITDAHLPPDLIDKARTTIRRVFPPDTAIIMFPTTRPAPNSFRQNTMGGQLFIVAGAGSRGFPAIRGRLSNESTLRTVPWSRVVPLPG